MYATLDSGKIISTLRQLERRIDERFPGCGLGRVCAELTRFADENTARVARISRPNTLLRALIGAFIAVSLALLYYVAQIIEFKRDNENLFGVMQGIDSFINVMIVAGAAILFLLTLEERLKRKHALADLHALRSFVHVIDMHQLTKDPSHGAHTSEATQSSPRRTMTPAELTRYLDYCSEMLSLSSKIAALYAQSLPDSVVVEAVSDLERLTSNLSSEIWQKIMIVEEKRLAERAVRAPAATEPTTVLPPT
ncbi:MAG: hypothetical protein R3D57_14255 [Hyphomicrobiaceae bacterium]